MVVVAAVLMSGCNLKEKISESITEEVVEKEAGNEADTETNSDEYEWPEDQAGVCLPKLENGIITYVLNGPDTCMLKVEDIGPEEYRDYKDVIVEAGFTNEVLESSAENLEIYSGASVWDMLVTLSYDGSEETLQITIERVEN